MTSVLMVGGVADGRRMTVSKDQLRPTFLVDRMDAPGDDLLYVKPTRTATFTTEVYELKRLHGIDGTVYWCYVLAGADLIRALVGRYPLPMPESA